MSYDAEKQEFARKACSEFCVRTAVLLVPRNDLSGVGSGILLRTDQGVPFLLTARHVVEDAEWRPLKLLVPGLGGVEVQDAGTEVQFAPGRTQEKPVDVAIVTLRDDLHDRLRLLAAGIESIATDDAAEPDDVVILCGFPTYLSFRSPADVRKHLFATITHITGVTGKDEHGRLKVEWNNAIPHEGSPSFPHLDVQPGKLMQLGSPGGISGGAVWRVRGFRADALWAPSSDAKLIGVPVAWDRRETEYAESVNAWGPWVLETARFLDSRR